MLVNNGTQSGPLNILYGGLAKGAGTFGSISIGDGGTFSPGNSPAAVTSESSTWSPGGNYTVELLDALGTPGNGFDQWNINGDLFISSGLTLNSVFTVSLVSLSSTSTAGLASNFIPGCPYLWPIATISGSVTGFDPAKLNLDLSRLRQPHLPRHLRPYPPQPRRPRRYNPLPRLHPPRHPRTRPPRPPSPRRPPPPPPPQIAFPTPPCHRPRNRVLSRALSFTPPAHTPP